MMIRGLVVDTEKGNVVKANRFGFVKQAFHGTQPIPYAEMRDVYARVIVDLSEPRWRFMNTLFSLSDGCLYAQLVDRLDQGMGLPGVDGYAALYQKVRTTVDLAHIEGRLKGEIVDEPERFVVLDPDTALALQDLKYAGKKLLLITNSDWPYTSSMMAYAFDRYLPGTTTWRDLFDVAIVDARKPAFFSQQNPLYEVATDEGLLRPVVRRLERGKAYSGGDAGLVEAWLGVSGEEVLYIGDHIFSDVHVSKSIQRWRTALVLRELEGEIDALQSFEERQSKLRALMSHKEALERESCALRVELQRTEHGYGPAPAQSPERARQRLTELRVELDELDESVAPLAREASQLASQNWGLLLRTGNDKSHLARQV
ncbi:MAG: HAD-IG family 5'-nucleotidase, partial [Myxococcota bacterium]